MKDVIKVQGAEIAVVNINGMDYISLTDMIKAVEGEYFISNWLRNRNTLDFLGVWEQLHNPSFNYVEFDTIIKNAGLNRFRMSAKDWTSLTRAIGIVAKTGRFGGTFAHKDIAFEFGMWLSAKFKVYLIHEFDRLKQNEAKQQSLEWNLSRTLSKINYRIHTDAVKEFLIPPELTPEQANFKYAEESDVLNMALFGKTAKQWRDEHPGDAKIGNIRDFAPLEHLIVLSNLESINAMLIGDNMPQNERLLKLNKTAITQLKSLYSDSRISKLQGQSPMKQIRAEQRCLSKCAMSHEISRLCVGCPQ